MTAERRKRETRNFFQCWATAGKLFSAATKTRARINNTRATAFNFPYIHMYHPHMKPEAKAVHSIAATAATLPRHT
jgi:hypothetical protein